MAFIERLLKLPINRSFFLFGARNTGKSTLIRKSFNPDNSFWIDLLHPEVEAQYRRDPAQLYAEVLALPETVSYVVIDEVQKVPKLLDVVHMLIEQTNKFFILTGSSARKLRHGGANLLAGRAFIYNLFPLTCYELGEKAVLDDLLRWGSLPSIPFFTQDTDKQQFLQAYALTYLKEEIWMEQFIKKFDPFRKFLEVSAQCNGKIINFANIAKDVGVDSKTVKEYFSILEDTLLGFFLEAFQHSFRKRLSLKPKFYYFDLGVTRALSRRLSVPLTPSTNAYGDAFEHFIILEAMRLSSYYFSEFRFSYLKTKDDAEIDLVVERPGQPILFIEIKSSTNVPQEKLSTLKRLSEDFGECEPVCFSQDTHAKRFGNITVYPWQEGLKKYFIAH